MDEQRSKSRLDQAQDRGDFFRSLGRLVAGFVAERVEEAVTAPTANLIRPPGAREGMAFLLACERCGACRAACPQDAILKAPPGAGLGAGTPRILPRAMPCFLCTELPCVAACPSGALSWPRLGDLEGPEAVRMGLARVREDRCLTFARDGAETHHCSTCADRCPLPGRALRMVEGSPGQPPRPVVDPASCTGCGLCEFGCPLPRPGIEITGLEPEG